jgi:hypothetical protein
VHIQSLSLRKEVYQCEPRDRRSPSKLMLPMETKSSLWSSKDLDNSAGSTCWSIMQASSAQGLSRTSTETSIDEAIAVNVKGMIH